MIESLKWALAAMDPEPGQKYFERHMHHVQNSSRKPVEINRELLADGFAVDTAGGKAHCLCIDVKARRGYCTSSLIICQSGRATCVLYATGPMKLGCQHE